MALTPEPIPPLTTAGLLSTHAASPDPALAALHQAVSERTGLSTKNDQLWKLIEKQRAGYNNLVKELERLRGERDAYKAQLSAVAVRRALDAGPEPEPEPGREGVPQLDEGPGASGIAGGSDCAGTTRGEEDGHMRSPGPAYTNATAEEQTPTTPRPRRS